MRQVPTLRTANLTGAVRYYDGFTNDARLTLDTLRSAAGSGTTLVNYCRFKDAVRIENGAAVSSSFSFSSSAPNPKPQTREEQNAAGAVWNCDIQDVLTGKTFAVFARTVVNATGPWADGLPHSAVKLRVTKGIHLVVERRRLRVPETVVMTEGKRILFAIPWGERTILGTTDTDYHGPLDEVTAEAADIRYVLQITNQFFPEAKLSTADVISSWAGLRPLVADPGGRPSDISRSHEIKNPEPGWWDVTGGKLTTHRLMAEQVVDQIVLSLKKSATATAAVAPCRTAVEPLLPASDTQNISGILPPEFCRRAVQHYCAHEWAVHLEDVMVRRTSWYQYERDAAQKAVQVADWMSELLGWTPAQRAAELQHYHAFARGPQVTPAASSAENLPLE